MSAPARIAWIVQEARRGVAGGASAAPRAQQARALGAPRCFKLTSWRHTTLAWQCRARRPGATWRWWRRGGQEGLQRRGWFVGCQLVRVCVAHTQRRKPAWHAPSRPSAAPGKELLLVVPVHVVDWLLSAGGRRQRAREETCVVVLLQICGPGKQAEQEASKIACLEFDCNSVPTHYCIVHIAKHT